MPRTRAAGARARTNITVTSPSREQAGDPTPRCATRRSRSAPGEFVSVVGPTGCGKSTLLNVAAGLLAAFVGRSARARRAARPASTASAGYMFQSDALMPWRSALDNVALGLRYRGVAEAHEAREQARDWLARVGLDGASSTAIRISFGRHEKARGARADADPGPEDTADGRAVLRARRADAAADGKRAARAVVGRPQVGACSSRTTSKRRSRCRIASSCCRPGPATHPIGEFAIDLPRPRDVGGDPHDAAFRRAARGDLARDEGRSAEGLCAEPDAHERHASPLSRTASRCPLAGSAVPRAVARRRVRILVRDDRAGPDSAVLFRRSDRASFFRSAAEGAAAHLDGSRPAESTCICGSRWSKRCSLSRSAPCSGWASGCGSHCRRRRPRWPIPTSRR